MADKKISQLTGASTPLAGTEVLPIVQSGSTVKVSVDNLTAGKIVKAATFDTDVAAAKVTLSATTLAASGTDTNIDISLTPKGTGEVNLPKVDIDGGAIDGTTIGANSAAAATFSGTKITSSAMSSATAGSVLEGSWPWQMWRDTESAQSTFVGYADGGFWYLKSVPFADRNSAPSGVGTDQFSIRDNGNVSVLTGNLVVGTAGKGIDFAGNGNVLWRCGSGTPEGAVTAPVGSLYTNTSGGANTTLYVKESGAGNTGWVAK